MKASLPRLMREESDNLATLEKSRKVEMAVCLCIGHVFVRRWRGVTNWLVEAGEGGSETDWPLSLSLCFCRLPSPSINSCQCRRNLDNNQTSKNAKNSHQKLLTLKCVHPILAWLYICKLKYGLKRNFFKADYSSALPSQDFELFLRFLSRNGYNK